MVSVQNSSRADGGIRYARCWEDADVLLAALDVQPGDTCLSIGAAGDNTLALLTRAPGRVIAIDRNPSQIACLALRTAGYRCLNHSELLELVGARASTRRMALYARCRGALTAEVRAFWDDHRDLVAQGIGNVGKFERYLALFRRWCLPLAHRQQRIIRLFEHRTPAARRRFYEQQWNTRRWRWLVRLFSSRWLLERLGRDAACFAHTEKYIFPHIARRVDYVLGTLNPADNPYIQWLLRGPHTDSLPLALREEHFATIRASLERLEWHCISLEDWLRACPPGTVQRFNLSDVFEYLSPHDTQRLYAALAAAGQSGARLACWNMQVLRSGDGLTAETPEGTRQIQALPDLAARCYAQDRVPFYSRFMVETIAPVRAGVVNDTCMEVKV